MSRFILSPGAGDDLAELAQYFQGLPAYPALRMGKALQRTLRDLATYPAHGHLHVDYSVLVQEPIRSFVSGHYVLFYAASRKPVVFLGIIHGKRNIDAIMRGRLG